MSGLGGSGARSSVQVERARLFVALELPAAAREALVGWRDAAVPGVEGLRLIAPECLHVTLCFLGWRPAAESGEILDACGILAGQGTAELQLGAAVWLPRRRPRVLAVKLDDPRSELAHAQAALSRTLQAGGWYAPEGRPFLAHVTVGRLAAWARVSTRELPSPPADGFVGARVTLYRTRLGAGGARYEPLGAIELGVQAERPRR